MYCSTCMICTNAKEQGGRQSVGQSHMALNSHKSTPHCYQSFLKKAFFHLQRFYLQTLPEISLSVYSPDAYLGRTPTTPLENATVKLGNITDT
jgi:hypothetical protein